MVWCHYLLDNHPSIFPLSQAFSCLIYSIIIHLKTGPQNGSGLLSLARSWSGVAIWTQSKKLDFGFGLIKSKKKNPNPPPLFLPGIVFSLSWRSMSWLASPLLLVCWLSIFDPVMMIAWMQCASRKADMLASPLHSIVILMEITRLKACLSLVLVLCVLWECVYMCSRMRAMCVCVLITTWLKSNH